MLVFSQGGLFNKSAKVYFKSKHFKVFFSQSILLSIYSVVKIGIYKHIGLMDPAKSNQKFGEKYFRLGYPSQFHISMFYIRRLNNQHLLAIYFFTGPSHSTEVNAILYSCHHRIGSTTSHTLLFHKESVPITLRNVVSNGTLFLLVNFVSKLCISVLTPR